MVDYQLFNMVGSNEPIYHWTVKMNEEKTNEVVWNANARKQRCF